MVSFLFLVTTLQDSTPIDYAAAFRVPPVIVESARIATTPVLDGKLEEEEWDPFASEATGSTFLQWQPGALNVAAKIPAGKDLVVSLDLSGNGWLIGADNLELRVQMVAGKPVLSGRLVDATNVNGPVWIPLPGFAMSSTAAVSSDGDGTTIEATFVDPGLGLLPEEEAKRVSVRMDALDANSGEVGAFVPRVLAPVTFVLSRSAGLPEGLRFKPEGEGKGVVPGQSFRLRYTFEGDNKLGLQRIALRSEGPAKLASNLLESPFPIFDNKKRAFIDYDSLVAAGASLGYRVARGTLTTADGLPGLTQISYRIAPPIDVELVRSKVVVSQTDRSQKQTFYIRSNSSKGVDGTVTLSIPDPIRILNGNVRSFRFGPRGRSRQTLELYVPANTVGPYPVTFAISANAWKYEQKGFVNVR